MWILVLVFIAFFAAVVLTGYAFSVPGSAESKQVMSRLEALTAPQSAEAKEEELVIRREEPLSAIPWLDAWLQKIDLSGRMRLLLYQAELSWTVGKLILASAMLGLASAALVHLRTGALLLSILVFLGGGAVPFLYVLQKRSRRFEQMRQFLPEALDLMSAAIRAGHSFTSAMGMASKESQEPVRREFRQCFDEQNYGLDLRGALSNLHYRMPIPEVGMIVTAVLIHSESGGNLTEILDKVAYLIRENYRLRRQVKVHTAQGRMSGWVLAIFPFVLGFLLYLINPVQMRVLWTHPTGRKLLLTGVVMTAVGGLCIRKIVRVRI